MSRSIIISLRRKLPEETVERLPFDLHDRMLSLRRRIARWTKDNAVKIGAMDDEPPACGNDRMQDNFTPLWRIAAVLGGAWPDRIATAYAAQAQAQDDGDEPAGVMMLHDIAELFATRTGWPDRIASAEIVTDLITLEDRPWAEWRHGKPLTATTVAKLMKPFGIKTKVSKLLGSSTRAYLRSEVEAAAARYAVQKCKPVTMQQNQRVNGKSKRNPVEKVTPSKLSNPLKSKEGYTVTLTDAGSADATEMDDPYSPDSWQ